MPSDAGLETSQFASLAFLLNSSWVLQIMLSAFMSHMHAPAKVGLQQNVLSAPGWTYVWLVFGGLLFVMMMLAFAYLLLRRQNLSRRLLQHSAFIRVDRWLSDHVPRLWTFVRRRLSTHPWHGLTLTAAIIFIFAAAYLFVMITESWTEHEALYRYDQQIYNALLAASNGEMTAFMQVITHGGDGLTITIISLLLGGGLLLRRYWWQVVSLFLSVGVGAALMWSLKWGFERGRPSEQIIQAAGHSFPSGHAFLAMTLYGFAIYLIWRFIKHNAMRMGITVLLVILIFLVGLSRVTLRVHWVSDVVGGFTIGLGWLVCSLVLSRVFQAYFTSRKALTA